MTAPASVTASAAARHQNGSATETGRELGSQCPDGSLQVPEAAPQPYGAAERPEGVARFVGARRHVRRDAGHCPPSAGQNDRLPRPAYLLGESTQLPARVNDRDGAPHV